MKQPKIALVHDYIKEYGGAERVLETLHEMYPDAPVFTLIYAPQFLGPHKERFKNWKIRPSFLQYIPFSYKFISIYRLIAPFVFKTFNFSGFDIVIVSATGAYNPNIIQKKSAKQICYCHTPPRYLYGYATAREMRKNAVMNIVVAVMNHILRMVDYVSSKNVDVFIANSHNVAERIKKFYRRDSVVVYPPVISNTYQVSSIKYQGKKGKNTNYYLAGGRLARPKHIDIIMRACGELGVPLKIFGKGFAGYGEELYQVLRSKYQVSNIEFLGEVSDEEKLQLMQNAKAFLFAAEDEDFGIVPVEAMSVGTPVIAYRSGGVLESVVDPSTSPGSPTGVFFDKLTEKSIMNAIKKFEKMKISAKDCEIQAEKFSKERFVKEIQKVINNLSSFNR